MEPINEHVPKPEPTWRDILGVIVKMRNAGSLKSNYLTIQTNPDFIGDLWNAILLIRAHSPFPVPLHFDVIVNGKLGFKQIYLYDTTFSEQFGGHSPEGRID